MNQLNGHRPVFRWISPTILVLCGLVALPSSAHTEDCDSASQAAVRSTIRNLLEDGVAGVEVRLGQDEGSVALRGGVEQLGKAKPFPREGQFRVFSISKTFTAVVVLQLVSEGKLSLDSSIESYLPHLLPAGDRISVRMLLQHKSGLHDYADVLHPSDSVAVRDRYVTYTPAQLVAASTAYPLVFEPGARHEYSNTNYVALAMLVEKITGKSYEHEVYRRILKPLELDDTVVPVTPFIPGPHGHGYLDPGNGLVDITNFNPSILFGAGSLISTTKDLDSFVHALFNGELLDPQLLMEMQTVTLAESPVYDGYGLGLYRMTTACGKQIWGHGGGGLGYFSFALSTVDGSRRISVVATSGRSEPNLQTIFALFDAYFCGG